MIKILRSVFLVSCIVYLCAGVASIAKGADCQCCDGDDCVSEYQIPVSAGLRTDSNYNVPYSDSTILILEQLYIKLQTEKVDKYQLIVTDFKLTEIFTSEEVLNFMYDEGYSLQIACISDNSNSLGLKMKNDNNGQWKYTIEVMLIKPDSADQACIYGAKNEYQEAKTVLDQYSANLPVDTDRTLQEYPLHGLRIQIPLNSITEDTTVGVSDFLN